MWVTEEFRSFSEHIKTTSTYWKLHLLNGTSEVSLPFTDLTTLQLTLVTFEAGL